MININNIQTFKLNLFTPKPFQPRFLGSFQYDTFERTTDKEADKYTAIKNALNITPANEDKFSDDLLDELTNRIANFNTLEYKYEPSNGEHLHKYAIRKYLLENLPTQNPFRISLITEELLPILKTKLSQNFLPSKLYTNDKRENKCTKSKINTSELNYLKTLSIMHKHESIDFVYDYIKPNIKEVFDNLDLRTIENIIKSYYMFYAQANRNFTYDISLTSNNMVKSTAYVDNEPLLSVIGKNHNESKALLFNEVLKSLNMELKKSDTPRRTRNRYVGNEFAKNKAEAVLKAIGFIKEDEKLHFNKDTKAIEYVLRAINLEPFNKDPYRFQILEYYGDSILNILVGKFLLKKNIPAKDSTHYYSMLCDNIRFKKISEDLNLDKFISLPVNERNNPKIMADVFEAIIGALYLSYPEEKIYKFLEPILEENFIYIKENLQQIRKGPQNINYEN